MMIDYQEYIDKHNREAFRAFLYLMIGIMAVYIVLWILIGPVFGEIYSYNTTIGDNDTITMYYDEPYPENYYDEDGYPTEEEWEEMEKEDEKLHEEEAKEWEKQRD